jgi:mRNA interferase HigB
MLAPNNFALTELMNVISFKRIREFTLAHRDAEVALRAWYTIAKKSQWRSLAEVKRIYPTADLVARYTIFNIKGNKYRLITRIAYRSPTVFIVAIMTHDEYDLGKWKE